MQLNMYRAPDGAIYQSELPVIEGSVQLTANEVTAHLLQEAAAKKRADLITSCDAALAAITNAYPAAERDTWEIQRLQAEAYTADPATPVPFIEALASARGITVAEQVDRITIKAGAYQTAAAAAIGKRQALEDQVNGYLAANQLLPEDPAYLAADAARAAIEAIVW